MAFDFAEEMIAHTLECTTQYDIERINYLVLDATDETALLELGVELGKASLMPLSAKWPSSTWLRLSSLGGRWPGCFGLGADSSSP